MPGEDDFNGFRETVAMMVNPMHAGMDVGDMYNKDLPKQNPEQQATTEQQRRGEQAGKEEEEEDPAVVVTFAMEIFEYFTYGMFALDLLDAALDYHFVGELAKHPDTERHAVWLGICTTIALAMEVLLKVMIQRAKRQDTINNMGDADDERLTDFNLKNKAGQIGFIMICSLMELMIFFIEDAATIYVWWDTGLYLGNAKKASALSKANLYITVASATAAVVGLIATLAFNNNDNNYTPVRVVVDEIKRKGCTFKLSGGLVLACLPPIMICGCLAFWAWFALTVIISGGSYRCLGACQTATAAESLAGAAVFDQQHAQGGAGDDLLYSAVAALLGRTTNFTEDNKLLLSQLSEFQVLNTTRILAATESSFLAGPSIGEALSFDNSSGFGEAEEAVAALGTYADDIGLKRSVTAIYVIGWILVVVGALATGFMLNYRKKGDDCSLLRIFSWMW